MDLEKLQLTGVEEKRPLVIAGPCSAETEDQVMDTAKELAKYGVKVFRAGIWKPRTKPGGFEGNGIVALPWMQQVKKETGMLTATEVATAKHVEEALNTISIYYGLEPEPLQTHSLYKRLLTLLKVWTFLY